MTPRFRTFLIPLAALAVLAAACGAETDISSEPSPSDTPATGESEAGDATNTESVHDPVVIVAGTFSPDIANVPLESRLRSDGYDAHIFVLPDLGVGAIPDSSEDLAAFVDEVLAESGAEHVDLVGHSQGGLVARYYVKELGGVDVVDSLITLGTPNYGTETADLDDSSSSSDICPDCDQMAVGSPFLESLNAGDDTIGDVEYTNIYTRFDMVVRPVENAELEDGATNVQVQSQCQYRLVGHVGLIFDGTVYSGIRNALEHEPIELDCWTI